jgi:hypothetical protein
MQHQDQKLNGVNGFKKMIQTRGSLIERMKKQFEDDLRQPKAIVEHAPICRPLHDFHVRSCCMTHRDFIRKIRDSPEMMTAEKNVMDNLAKLEKLRKMLVNNKQQRKTEHNQFSRALCEIRAMLPKPDVTEFGEGFSIEDVPDHASIRILKQIDVNAKQHHRTVAQNILEIARTTDLQLLQFIMVFQLALDGAVGAIIHHAEKCRTHNGRTLHLALVEFCASRWWFDEHEEMDPSDYFVSAEADDAHGIQIRINATGAIPATPVSGSMVFDESLSQLVLTAEAIDAFESEQTQLLREQQEAKEMHRRYEEELAQYYKQQTAKLI